MKDRNKYSVNKIVEFLLKIYEKIKLAIEIRFSNWGYN
jgi:hypothetical protein